MQLYKTNEICVGKNATQKKLHHLCLLDSFSNFKEYNRIKVVKFNWIGSYKGSEIQSSKIV